MSAPSLPEAKRRTFSPVSTGALLLAFAASCTVGPDYQQPQLELPDRWSAERGTGPDSILVDDDL
ncbi:MAG TPA: hypothetical protein VK081_15135, partial [Planctomycetota bacterium]|nr:hypothetical protein [Planctomycetota bacterium]